MTPPPAPPRVGHVGRAIAILCRVSATLLLAHATAAGAQERTGHIHGKVVDASGGVIVGATVKMTDTLTGYQRTVVTNDEGLYSAPRLPTGNYTLDVQAGGFKTARRAGITLSAGLTAEVNVPLEVGNATDEVEVRAAQPVVNTTSGAVRTAISQIFVDRLPLAGRDANELIELVPGMTTGVKGNYAANGLRETSNNFTLNGTDNSDIWSSIAKRNPPPDALQEFTIQSNYSAEYGRGGGVAVLANTKSGTNQLRGSAYDYFRSENLNANTFERNAANLPKAEFKQHQWGVTVGGPVIVPRLYDGRNRTFFFFNAQRLSTPATSYVYRRGGLTAAELAGDFSQSATVPRVSTAAAAQPNSPFAGMAGQPITNLRPFLSQTAVKWYQLFDLPIVQRSGEQFLESRTRERSEPEYTWRGDQSIGTNHRLSLSGFYRSEGGQFTQINNAPEGFMQGSPKQHHHYALSHVWTLRPTIVNEMMVGYNRLYDTRQATFGSVDFAALGMPFAPLSQRQFIAAKPVLAPSQFNLAGSSSKFEARDLYDFRNTVSIFKGRHLLKGGITAQIHNITAENLSNMEYSYEGRWLGNRAAEFLIGWPQSFGSIAEPSYKAARRNVLHMFIQDDWKVTSRLALNLGVRWEPQQWGYLKQNNALIFIPGAVSHYSNFPKGTITISEPPSPGRAGRKNDWNNFAPRLGAAYRLDDEGRRVVRGGWGIFYDTLPGVHDGTDLQAEFPFTRSWGTSFDRGYPGPEGWLNIFAYDNVPVPDFSKPADLATAFFNPRGAPGRYQPDIPMGFVHQVNATYEQEFRPGWSYSAGYVGSRGVDLWGLDFWNLPVATGRGDNWNEDNLAARRPDQNYARVQKSFVSNNAESNYHAAQFTLKATTRSFHMLSHYTYSRAYGNIDGVHTEGDAVGYGRSHGTDLSVDWARSVMDIPHRLMVISSYDLPFARDRRGVVGTLLGQWSVTSVFQIQSGRPVNVLAAQNNTFTCQPCWVRPDATGEPLINENWRSDPKLVYVNEAAFRQPADGTFGNLPRNAIRWPHFKTVDFSVMKTLPAVRNARLQLRADTFNLFNWVNFNAPARVRPGAENSTLSMFQQGFGQPRNMQVSVRIVF